MGVYVNHWGLFSAGIYLHPAAVLLWDCKPLGAYSQNFAYRASKEFSDFDDDNDLNAEYQCRRFTVAVHIRYLAVIVFCL